MSVDVGQLIGGALGGAIASSVLTPLISQRGERRGLRADVLHRLGDVERLRWFHTGDQVERFRRALVALRAAGLLAGANRALIDYYCHVAWTARLTSEHAVEIGDDVGGIPSTLGDLVTDAATAVSDDVWHPTTRRWRSNRKVEQLRFREQRLREGPDRTDIEWPSVDA
jgi:hypothetical protein